jgi:hypothetical protein
MMSIVPNPVWLVLYKKRNLDTYMHKGRMSFEDAGRGQVEACRNEKIPMMSSKPPETRREACNIPSYSLEKYQSLPTP